MTNPVSTTLADYDTKFIIDTLRLIEAKTHNDIIEVIREQTGWEYDTDSAHAAGYGALSERTRVLIRRLQAAEARVAELEAERNA